MKIDDLTWSDSAETRPPRPRPLPPRPKPSAFPWWVKPVVGVLLAAFVFVVGMSIGDDAGERAAFDAEVARQAAENRVGIITEERDSLETSVTILTGRLDEIESELTSATQAADLYRMRSEDASAALAAVEEDMEALKRDLARIQQQSRTVPAASSVKQASTTTAGWQTARASWYGPGFYGNTMAGGGVLTPESMVVAHLSLDFGTRIEVAYNGRTCIAEVRDRGPYIADRTFDLGPGVATALGFSGVQTIQWRVVS